MKKSSRRYFLQTSTFACATALSAGRVIGANNRIRTGFIGLGGRGSWLQRLTIRHIEENQDSDIVALCDVYARRLNEAHERNPEAKTYRYHQELLDRSDLDAVFIATPDHWHAPITLMALERGLDVYCEKPMTLYWEEAKEVARRAKQLNRVLQIGVQALSWSKWHKAKDIVEQGLLGRVVCCQGTYSRNVPFGDWNYYEIDPNAGPSGKDLDHIDWKQWLGPAQDRPFDADRYFRFRKYWDYSGGIATDLHYHTVAPFHLAVKNEHPTRISGMGGIWIHDDGREVPDTFLTAADYPSKFSLTVQSSQANEIGLRTLIRGEKATLYCGADWEGESYGHMKVIPEKPFKEEFIDRCGKEELIVPDIKDEGDEKHIDNFFDCIRTRELPNCHADLAFKVMTAIALSVRSHREGKMFYYDADREIPTTRC
ncbi:MAG: Gfo/Idh/MocA family oxidoreductase [Candidatus Omnitrophica bacterium]|nr:Gfo/Idh/MocA family oxidoreductase [Candidatus Omnitrophota bacterium]